MKQTSVQTGTCKRLIANTLLLTMMTCWVRVRTWCGRGQRGLFMTHEKAVCHIKIIPCTIIPRVQPTDGRNWIDGFSESSVLSRTNIITNVITAFQNQKSWKRKRMHRGALLSVVGTTDCSHIPTRFFRLWCAKNSSWMKNGTHRIHHLAVIQRLRG